TVSSSLLDHKGKYSSMKSQRSLGTEHSSLKRSQRQYSRRWFDHKEQNTSR
ncbi:hypothetical protein L9F63_003123, partial [Diploptera punctata]